MTQEEVRPLFIEVDRNGEMLSEDGAKFPSRDPEGDTPRIAHWLEKTLRDLARGVAAGDPIFMVVRGPAVKRSEAIKRVAQDAARLAERKLAWIEWDVHEALASSPWFGQKEAMLNQFAEIVRKTAQDGHPVVVYLDLEKASAARRADNSNVLGGLFSQLHGQPGVATFLAFEKLDTVDPAIFRKVPSVVIPD